MKLITLAERYKYTCYWCKNKFSLDDLSRDHIVPVNKGSRGGGKGGIKNCVLSCISCNQDRGNLPFENYRYLLNKKKQEINNNIDNYPEDILIKPSRIR